MATRTGRVRRYSSCQVTSDSISRSETVGAFFSKLKFRVFLLFLNRNKNSQNSPKRMHPKKPQHFKVTIVNFYFSAMRVGPLQGIE